MILVDINQVLISNLMMQLNYNPNADLDENLIRHIVLNSLRSYLKQFKTKYGDMVICCDSKKYWRKEVFPYYKSHRKKDRDNSGFDWNLIFDVMGRIREELKVNFPYRVIDVEGAEADDVIAVLAGRYSAHEEILILSSDKDFVQLQKFRGVKQYSPILKRFVSTDNPELFVKEHILKGDKGDGIPNFLSADDVFANGERQKSINKNKLMEWLKADPATFCTNDTMHRGYKRNQMLVDLDYIPEALQRSIVETFENAKPGTKANMLNYFIEKKLRNLLEVVDEF